MARSKDKGTGGGTSNDAQTVPLETVSFSFTDIDGPELEWIVRRFHWSEGLSQTYELTLDLLTPDLEANTDELLGAKVTFEIERGDLLHTAYGIVHRVDYVGITSDMQALRAYVVPAFRLLKQQVDTKIFQGMTVIEIIDDVLGAALAVYGREVDSSSEVYGTYNTRDYCVQYRESVHDFVCRLLEEEGIAYYFKPDDEGHCEKLVLADGMDAYGTVPLVVGDEVPIIADRAELADTESLRFMDWIQPEQINQVVTRASNWKGPSVDTATATRTDTYHHRVRETYEHQDRRQIVDAIDDDGFTGESLDQRETQGARRLELFTRGTQRGQGRSNVTGFMPGLTFTLAEHSRADLEQVKYLLTRVVHTGEAPEKVRDAQAISRPRYDNSFECIPHENQFRPAIVTPKPRVYGPQTAKVVGPSGEEIHTDQHGRIKVHFHWDRVGPEDASASCWVRVAQTWAGPGWGTMFIPRIGMEVVVEFLEGNPDRPLVTGCVYNGTNPPPYTLPDDRTKSTIKSNSSLGGGGFNEFRFEDSAGNEEIYLHAQKDLNETVLHDHTTDVGNDQTDTVGNDQTITVQRDQTITVNRNVTETIQGAETRTVTGDVTETFQASETLNLTGDQTHTIGGSVTRTVTGSVTDTITGTLDQTVTGGITSTTPASHSMTATAGITMTTAGAMNVTATGGFNLTAPGGVNVVDASYWSVGSAAGSLYGQQTNVFGQQFNIALAMKNDFNLIVSTVSAINLAAVGIDLGAVRVQGQKVSIDLSDYDVSLKKKALAVITAGFYSLS